MKSFTTLKNLATNLSNNISSANDTLMGQLINDQHRYLLQKYYSNEGSYTMPTVSLQQFYKMPPNYSKLKTLTITIGNLKWTPTEVLTREEWDKLNVFPYYSDIPNNYFIYPGGDHGGQVGIWPIPSSNGNIITFNYKFRVTELSIADVTDAATTSVTTLTTAVTNSATPWALTTNVGQESRWLRIAEPKGDNLWYQIAAVTTTAALTLYQPYQGITVVSGTGTVGQMPLLAEDFHDMLVYGALKTYFSSIKPDINAFKQYDAMYKERLELMEEYSGSNTINVNLGRRPQQVNPNLFPQSIG